MQTIIIHHEPKLHLEFPYDTVEFPYDTAQIASAPFPQALPSHNPVKRLVDEDVGSSFDFFKSDV